MSENKNKEEEIKKGDVPDAKKEEDIDVVIDPNDKSKEKAKYYGTKLVDGGGCSAIV